MLRFSKMNILLQFAIDFVDTGEMPDYTFKNDEERTYFDHSVQQIMADRAEGHYYIYSVGDYDDDDDDNDDDDDDDDDIQ